ncbi:MAG: SIMPL domain-containing protein [Treponema sp.]|jgi:uncharacterized protein YggE|nr:SIMPL domain-containing protein [Treponema sp.]
MKKNKGTLHAAFILFAFLVLLSFNTTNVYGQSSITVTGTGTILAQPDMVQMSVSLSNVARTTRQAQIEVNKIAKQLLDILNEAGIEDKNIRTASLRFNSEYEYRGNRRVLTGQKVEQTIVFSVDTIGVNVEKAPEILDKITQLDNVRLNQIHFGIKDDTELLAKSREAAYQKALAKAEQYAELSGLKIVKVLNISEDGARQISPRDMVLYAARGFAGGREAEDVPGSILPTGELEISTQISVIFLAE